MRVAVAGSVMVVQNCGVRVRGGGGGGASGVCALAGNSSCCFLSLS